MLKTMLKRLKPQAEKIIAEEQAGFRAGTSTSEQIFNLRILREKYRRAVEAAVQSLKKTKSAGVENIQAELVQAGGE